MFSLLPPPRLTVCFFLLAVAMPAAEPKKKTASAKPAVAPASLRVWKADFESKRTVKFILRPEGKKSALTELGSFSAEAQFGDYTAVPSGACTIEVKDAADAKTPLATITTRFIPGTFYSLIAREKAGAVSLEMLDDTPADEATAELIVRNFVPSLQALQIDAGPDIHVRLPTGAPFLHLGGLPLARMQLDISGTDRSSQPIQWSNEVDFTKIRRATLLIHTDPYQRVRPRVTIDGAPPAGADSSAAPGDEKSPRTGE